jgi:hypothetical protein
MLKTQDIDLWVLHGQGYYLVDPTNLTLDNRGANVMGGGISLQVKQRYPDAPKFYGDLIRTQTCPGAKPGSALRPQDCTGPLVFLDETRRLIYFPTKYDWHYRSSLSLIEKGLGQLVAILNAKPELKIALPPLGAGLGGLDWQREVWPLLNKILDCPELVERIVVCSK